MKILTIRLKVSDVVYDIRNKAWLTARARDNGTNYKQVAFLKPDNEGGDLSQVKRSIGSAWSAINKLLVEYIPTSDLPAREDFVATPNADETGEYLEVTLWLPNNYNEGTREILADLLHRYIVASALGEWLRLNVAPDADKYFAEAARIYDEVWAVLGARVRPERPGQLPPDAGQ